jgi:cell division protein FtsL
MSPVASAGAPAVRPRRAPRPAPARPRRVSGPARARKPAARSAPPAGLAPLAGLVARTPGLLDRLVRGRALIAIVAFALIGIVAAQLWVVKLGVGIGRAIEHEGLLRRENSALSIEDSRLSSAERIERLAAARGMVVAAPGALHFDSVRGSLDARLAAGALARAEQARATGASNSSQEAAGTPVGVGETSTGSEAATAATGSATTGETATVGTGSATASEASTPTPSAAEASTQGTTGAASAETSQTAASPPASGAAPAAGEPSTQSPTGAQASAQTAGATAAETPAG